jgi:hypothetical protein
MPTAAKASLLGAKTVKGPVPLKVVARPALVTAALRVLNSLVVVTRVAIFGVVSFSFLQAAETTKTVKRM